MAKKKGCYASDLRKVGWYLVTVVAKIREE
jgi:hypothetical protein